MQKHFAIASLSILIFLTSSSLVAGKTQSDTCPPYGPWLRFYSDSMFRTWWMYAISPSGGPITASPCEHLEYSGLNNNDLKVTEYGVDGSNTPAYGTMISKRQGVFEFTSDRFSGTRQYNVHATDYKTYYIVENCQYIDGKPLKTQIIYTAEANPSQAVIKDMLRKENMTLKGFTLIDQKNCQ